MDEVVQQIRSKHPLIGRIYVKEIDEKYPAEQVLLYFGLFSSVFEKTTKNPICFVLPRCGDIPRLATIIYAAEQFSRKFASLASEYAQTQFKVGDRICINPSGHVYKIAGYDGDPRKYFKLAPLSMGGGRNFKTFPLSEVLRVQKTQSLIPKGQCSTQLRNPEEESVDKILGTRTYGNKSLYQNEVVVLDDLGAFKKFTEGVGIQGEATPVALESLKEMFPFGGIVESSNPQSTWLKLWENKSLGEPLVAVTHSRETMSSYCLGVPARSKVVIAVGLSRFKNNLQIFDDLSESQNLFLFAQSDEEDMIRTLGERGCKFWYLNGMELLNTEAPALQSKIQGTFQKCSFNSEKLVLEGILCENQHLDVIYSKLFGLRGSGPGEEDVRTRIISRAWGLFVNICGLVSPMEPGDLAKANTEIASILNEISLHSSWIAEPIRLELLAAVDAIQYATSFPDLGKSKGSCLLDILIIEVERNLNMALIVRNENEVERVIKFVRADDRLRQLKVYSPRTLPEEDNFDTIIMVSWPGVERVGRILSKSVTARVCLVGYPWEIKWLTRYENKLKGRLQSHSLTSEEKSALLSDVSSPVIPWPDVRKDLEKVAAASHEIEPWTFERKLAAARIGIAAAPTEATETVMAKYVRFSGNFYAFLTESHKIPMITPFVSSKSVQPRSPEKKIADIRPDDFLVFPESGSREFIQILADKLLGLEARKFRETAYLWKKALHNSGLTQDKFFKIAQDLGHSRHKMTVRHWFTDDTQIGPARKDDLILVALATEDKAFEDKIDLVWEAISKLWGMHLSAGARLKAAVLQKLPNVMGDVEEGGKHVNLGELGGAWIVQVESISDVEEPRGYNEVNRLFTE